MAGCSTCGGGSTQAPKRYQWTSPEGKTLVKNSQTEVEYLVSRKGGTWKQISA